MAANFYFVFVKHQEESDVNQVLAKLGYGEYKPTKEVDLWNTSKPKNLYVGEYNRYLIFSEPNLPFQFYNKEPSEIEIKFCETFPNAQISAFVINETVGMFGYSIIENGIRKRIKHGCDGAYYIDFGEKLIEEVNHPEQPIFDEETIEEMEENGENIDALIEFEMSYRVPSRLISSYLGKDFYTLKDGEVKVVCYE